MPPLSGAVRPGCTEDAVAVVTRLQPGPQGIGARQQTILIELGWSLKEVIFNADGHGDLDLRPGPAPSLEPAGPDEERRPFPRAWHTKFLAAVWDPFSSSTILLTYPAVYLLTPDNALRLLAGHMTEAGDEDGVGSEARFDEAWHVASDGQGALYISDSNKIRKVQLPASLQGRWPEAGDAVGSTSAGPASTGVTVTTLPFEAVSDIHGIVFSRSDGGPGSLIYASDTALYRVALGDGPEGSNDSAAAQPVLLAGGEGEVGDQDGEGAHARFNEIMGLDVDAEGTVYLTDKHHNNDDDEDDDGIMHIRRVTASGRVSRVVSGIRMSVFWPSILPSGYLALCGEDDLCFYDLKLRPVPLVASAAAEPPRPPPRTLPTDLGALLDRQPDGTADVTVVVGDRSFPAHRLLLSTRSDYFQQRLAGDFADSSAQQLSLPDADPDAFALVLRFLYTGAVDIPSALAPAVAELADRLLLPELCREAQARVLAEVRPETVVERLLWAEAQGHSFSQLLSDLKAWYLEHHGEVVAGARSSLKRLAAGSPDLMVEFYIQQGKRPRLQ